MKRNNEVPSDITSVKITREKLTFELEDGRTVAVPLAFYPTRLQAGAADRNAFKITHSSVYWPKLDCDISSACLLRGAREDRRYAGKASRPRRPIAA